MNKEQEEILQQRFRRLRFVAIFSLINIGFDLLNQIQSWIVGPLSSEKLEASIQQSKELAKSMGVQESAYDTFDKMYQLSRLGNANFALSHGLATVGSIVGLLGVIMMLQRKGMGFHGYIIYSIIACFGLFLYVPFNSIPLVLVVINVIFSGLFILYYYMNRTWEEPKLRD